MIKRRLLWAICGLLATATITEGDATTATTTATITIFSSITLSPASLSFGNQVIGTAATQAITVKNGGTAAFAFAASLTGSSRLEFSVSNPCGSLASGASCQVSVTFSPTVASSATASLVIAGSGRSYTAALSGTGTNMIVAPVPVSIALSPASIQIEDNATGGSIVSRATVTMSDGSNFTGSLTTSDTHYYAISGMNIVLAHNLSPADDGAHNTVIGIGP